MALKAAQRLLMKKAAQLGGYLPNHQWHQEYGYG